MMERHEELAIKSMVNRAILKSNEWLIWEAVDQRRIPGEYGIALLYGARVQYLCRESFDGSNPEGVKEVEGILSLCPYALCLREVDFLKELGGAA